MSFCRPVLADRLVEFWQQAGLDKLLHELSKEEVLQGRFSLPRGLTAPARVGDTNSRPHITRSREAAAYLVSKLRGCCNWTHTREQAGNLNCCTSQLPPDWRSRRGAVQLQPAVYCKRWLVDPWESASGGARLVYRETEGLSEALAQALLLYREYLELGTPAPLDLLCALQDAVGGGINSPSLLVQQYVGPTLPLMFRPGLDADLPWVLRQYTQSCDRVLDYLQKHVCLCLALGPESFVLDYDKQTVLFNGCLLDRLVQVDLETMSQSKQTPSRSPNARLLVAFANAWVLFVTACGLPPLDAPLDAFLVHSFARSAQQVAQRRMADVLLQLRQLTSSRLATPCTTTTTTTTASELPSPEQAEILLGDLVRALARWYDSYFAQRLHKVHWLETLAQRLEGLAYVLPAGITPSQKLLDRGCCTLLSENKTCGAAGQLTVRFSENGCGLNTASYDFILFWLQVLLCREPLRGLYSPPPAPPPL